MGVQSLTEIVVRYFGLNTTTPAFLLEQGSQGLEHNFVLGRGYLCRKLA
jgi:hypothetical protein